MQRRLTFFDFYCLVLIAITAFIIFEAFKSTIPFSLDIGTINYISKMLNTNFGIAATGSFFGAVGGYVMVWYTNRRSEILSMIRHTKTAIAVSHSIFNVFLGLKRQHVKSLCADYKENQSNFTKAYNGNASGEVRVPMGFKTISMPYLDLSLISSEFFEKTDLTFRARSLALTLITVIQELKAQIQYREDVFSEIAAMSKRLNLDEKGTACLLYGLELQDTRGNKINFQKNNDVMKAIGDFTDDSIWFSKELTNELIEIANKFSRKIIIGRPKASSIDYSDVPLGLIPEDENYKDWIEKFSK